MGDTIELARRHGSDGAGGPQPFLTVAPPQALPEVLHLAGLLSGGLCTSLDVVVNGEYLVTYCGASPYWWPQGTLGGDMHQLSSRGWCHTCRSEGRGYVHHLPLETEVAVLTCEATHDGVLREQCEADAQTPEQYAREMAGNRVPLDGDELFAVSARILGAPGTEQPGTAARFAVTMMDGRVREVTVAAGPGAEGEALSAAEAQAAADPGRVRRCVHCHGARGHSARCPVRRLEELAAGIAGEPR
jgi:hypothetical protein